MIEELDAHLREGAAAHGEPEAVRRMGDARAVAESFTPRAADRLFEQRDRLAALLMLAAMAASLPLARTLEQLGRPDPSHAWPGSSRSSRRPRPWRWCRAWRCCGAGPWERGWRRRYSPWWR